MYGKRLVVFAIGAALATAAAFDAGRQTERPLAAAPAHGAESHSGTSTSFKAETSGERPDLNKVTIENIGSVSFEQAYQVVRSAPREQRKAWARQLEKMPDGPQKNAGLSGFFRLLVQIDARAAVDLVRNSRDPRTRIVGAEAIAAAAPETAYWQVAELFLEILKSDRDVEWSYTIDVLEAWSKADPTAAARFAEEHSDYGPESYAKILRNWAAADPSAAKLWFDGLDEGHQSPEAIRGLVSGWIKSDVAAATEYLARHAGEPKFKEALERNAPQFFEQSPDSARSLVMLLPDAASKQIMVDEIVQRATGMFLHAPRSFYFKKSEVTRWLVALPQELWSHHMGVLATRWDRDEHADFAAWLVQLPRGMHDAVVIRYCKAADAEEAPAALELAATIINPTVRQQALQQLVVGFGRTRAEANDFVQRLSVTNAQKAQLLRLLPSK